MADHLAMQVNSTVGSIQMGSDAFRFGDVQSVDNTADYKNNFLSPTQGSLGAYVPMPHDFGSEMTQGKDPNQRYG